MFSKKLETWLKDGKPKTVNDLQKIFDEKSFAILFLIFMFIPSLPIPTGGITHVFLLPVVMLAATQMIFGRRSLWFPQWIGRKKLSESTLAKGLPFMIRRIRWFEKFSRPRLARYLDKAWFRTFTGICMFIFALAAFIAPPFSGLDTLPSMGAAVMALALILEDIVVFAIGLLIGATGIGLIVATAGVISVFVHHFFL